MANPLQTLMDIILRRSSQRSSAAPSEDPSAALRREGYGLDEAGEGSADAGAALRREGYGLDESDPDEQQSTLIPLQPMENPELVAAGAGEGFQLEDDGDIDVDSDDGVAGEEIDV